MSEQAKEKTPPTPETKAPEKAPASVKVRALRPFEEKGRVVAPGEILEVSADRAKELTTRVEGSFDFFGERYLGTRDHRRFNLAKAELSA